MRHYFLTALFLTTILLSPTQTALAADANEAKQPPSPNWTHPKMRKHYKGYDKIKDKQSAGWQYKTNRQGGNVRGGGTTEYEDYRPFYQPYPVKGDKRNNRNKR